MHILTSLSFRGVSLHAVKEDGGELRVEVESYVLTSHVTHVT